MAQRKRIGEYLVERGILTNDQVDQILKFSRSTGLRFGEAGMEMGILSREGLIEAFGKNYLIDFFHVHPDYFPQATRELLPKEAILRFGALPLGYKQVPGLFKTRKLLNLGLLDPSRRDAIEAVTEIARPVVGEQLAGVKTYLILASDFLPIVEKVYGGVPKSPDGGELDPTLRMYLED